MPLNENQSRDLLTAAAQEEVRQVAAFMEKLEALRPEAGALESRFYIYAVGALWYGLMAGLRQVRSEREAIRTDFEAQAIAALLMPGLIDRDEVTRKIREYAALDNPNAKA